MDIDVAHNPFELAIKLDDEKMTREKAQGLFFRTFDWFHSIARALKQLDGRYKIEACDGDVMSVLEQIRYGAVGHRDDHKEVKIGAGDKETTDAVLPASEDSPANDLRDYPVVYDRIYLSNIPDYIGGSLTSFMYALPALYPGEHSYVTSCCLQNPPNFKTPTHFNNEYIGLNAPSVVEKLFHT